MLPTIPALPLLGSPTQLGLLARNADAMMARLTAGFGLSPWRVEVWPPVSRRANWEAFSAGHSGGWEARLGFAYFRQLEVEVIEVTSGRCGYTDHLDRHGDGLHHIQFRVPDIAPVLRHFESLEVPIVMGASGRASGTYWRLFDTLDDFGFLTEVLHTGNPTPAAC